MRHLMLLTLAAIAGASNAEPIFLENGNASATFDTFTDSGGYLQSGWSVDGINQLANQSFFIRLDGRTAPVQGLTDLAPTAVVTTDTGFDGLADTLVVTYAVGGLAVEVRYELAGGTNGSGVSTLNEVVTITNTTQSDRGFTFWQYVDFDLNGSSSDLGPTILGDNTARQSDDLSATSAEEVVTPGALDSQVGFSSDVLDAVLAGSLDGTTGGVGVGDWAWAFEWAFELGAGDSIVISKKKSIVPAPGAAALFAMGLGVAARRRRTA